MPILPSVKQGWEKDVKTYAQGYSEMAQLVKVLAATEFHLWDPRGERREPISGSYVLTYTQFNLGFLFVFIFRDGFGCLLLLFI